MNFNRDSEEAFSIDPINRARAQSLAFERPQPIIARKKLSFDEDFEDAGSSISDADSSPLFFNKIKKSLSETRSVDLFQKESSSSPRSEYSCPLSSPLNKPSHRSLFLSNSLGIFTNAQYSSPHHQIKEDVVCEEIVELSENAHEDLNKEKNLESETIFLPRLQLISKSLDSSSLNLRSVFHECPEEEKDSPRKSNFSPKKNNPNFDPQSEDDSTRTLPITCKNLKNPDLVGVSPETVTSKILVVDLLNNKYNVDFLIVDCRYNYEYKGGHIRGAINITSHKSLEDLFIRNRERLLEKKFLQEIKNNAFQRSNSDEFYDESLNEKRIKRAPIIIFHCEFSQKRGPRGFRTLRNLDRHLNTLNWPNLYYPEVYLLEGGYKEFHNQFPDYCDPKGSYVEMVDEKFKFEYATAKEEEYLGWRRKTSFEDAVDVEEIENDNKRRSKTMIGISNQ